MTDKFAILNAVSPSLMCEAQTRRGRRCCNIPSGRHNGLSLCMRHLRQSQKVFADAEKRWQDAGQPEGDL